MNTLMSRLSPSITNMIRTDHTHLLATFHKYRSDKPAQTRQALVNMACLGLSIHTQLEEEIFYPALRSAGLSGPVLDKSVPEHSEMRRLMDVLGAADPHDPTYDATFMELMRTVMHHVADEETVLLADAERVIEPEQLAELGAEMTRRRLKLAAPHAGEMAMNTMRAAPPASMLLAAGALVAGTYIVRRALSGRHAFSGRLPHDFRLR